MDLFAKLFGKDDEEYSSYTDVKGSIRYVDGSALKRPLSFPKRSLVILAVFVVVAAIIGYTFWNNLHDEIVNAPIREAEETQANLNRDVGYGTPILWSIIQMDDATMIQMYTDAGYTIYDLSSADESGSGFDIIKLPEDVSLTEAALMYSQGVSNLSSAEAAKLLKGSWRLTVGRSGYVDMNTKYADFSSGSVEAAIQEAIAFQSFTDTTFGESGTDSAGNTFQSGTMEVNGTVYNWRISACPLSEVYSVDGLPSTAVYVGVRMYQ